MKKAKISVTPDQMSVTLRAVGMETTAPASLPELRDELAKLGVKFGIDLTSVEAWFVSDTTDDLLIAKGSYAKNGRDGYVKFLVDASAKPQFVPEALDGSKGVDYRKAMRVALVEPEQKIAEIILPSPGEVGTNVMGGTMAPMPGNPVRVNVSEGAEQRGNDVFAKVAGTPNFRDSVITVRKIYEIAGNVSFETGNINFPGTVVVKGDVIDDFEINAQEHVIIQGLVSAAKITAGGYIQCLGGVFGKGKAELRANSFIETRFCDAAMLCSDADITITKDILNSKVYSLGLVKCAGSIIGGEVMALKGVESAEIGTEMGTKTIVGIRKHYRQEKAKEMIVELMAEANAINERYRRWAQLPQLSPDDLDLLDKDLKQINGIIQKKKTLDLQIDKFERLLGENKGAAIRVHKMLWADVILEAPYCKYSPVEKTSGPINVTDDVSHGSMKINKG